MLCSVLVIAGLARPQVCKYVSMETHLTAQMPQWSLEKLALRTCPNTQELDPRAMAPWKAQKPPVD